MKVREKTFDVVVIGTGDFDADGKGCSTCKYLDDIEQICQLRRCIHAFHKLTDRYVREDKGE